MTGLRAKWISRAVVLLNPWFLTALALLIVNDHFLKQLYPSLLTGKLSDFAGLYVFAVFLGAIFPSMSKSRAGVLWLHVITAAGFVIWKVAPVELLLDEVMKLTGLPMPIRVKDATDLIALIILPLSYYHLMTRTQMSPIGLAPKLRYRLAGCAVLLLSGWSIVATSQTAGPEVACCEGMSGNVDNDELETVDIADILSLEDYLYHRGARPDCLLEADVNGTRDKNPVNGEDLIYLTEYVFSDGPVPCDCLPHY